MKFYTVMFVAGMALVGSTKATPISINYANTPGAHIQFNGAGNFSFTPDTSGEDFFINTGGSVFDDLGTMTGTYSIGTVTSSGGMESAPVTGAGTLTIADGMGHDLTAALSWINITQIGTGSILNLGGVVNMTGVVYTGTDPILLALAAGLSDSDTLDFTFNPAMSLDQLKTTSANTTFSGSIATIPTVPDGGGTAIMLGAALCAMGFFQNKLRNSLFG